MAQVLAPVVKTAAAFQRTTPWTIRIRRLVRSSRPYYTLLGIGLFFVSW